MVRPDLFDTFSQSKVLDLVVYDHDFAGKDDFMGRASIDLTSFEPERTHNVEKVHTNAAYIILPFARFHHFA